MDLDPEPNGADRAVCAAVTYCRGGLASTQGTLGKMCFGHGSAPPKHIRVQKVDTALPTPNEPLDLLTSYREDPS